MMPRLGFLGVGWIGQHRLECIAKSGLATIAGVADAAGDVARDVAEKAGRVPVSESLDDLLHHDLDGIVIATPSALHAEQCIAALRHGVAVFCQKPLARDGGETRRVVEAARRANRLLGVDLSYRFTDGMRRIRELIEGGQLGEIYAVDLVFHNAYGPGKAWFYDPIQSGGGCVIDLGIHLVDLALWTLGFPRVTGMTSRLYSRGKPLPPGSRGADASGATQPVEDFASAQMELSSGTVVTLSCSWNAPAGCDAVIGATFFGTVGGAALRNVDGSFHDFVAERFIGTRRERLATPPDDWGGRAAVDWVRRLSEGAGFDPAIERIVDVATTLDAIYGR